MLSAKKIYNFASALFQKREVKTQHIWKKCLKLTFQLFQSNNLTSPKRNNKKVALQNGQINVTCEPIETQNCVPQTICRKTNNKTNNNKKKKEKKNKNTADLARFEIKLNERL